MIRHQPNRGLLMRPFHPKINLSWWFSPWDPLANVVSFCYEDVLIPLNLLAIFLELIGWNLKVNSWETDINWVIIDQGNFYFVLWVHFTKSTYFYIKIIQTKLNPLKSLSKTNKIISILKLIKNHKSIKTQINFLSLFTFYWYLTCPSGDPKPHQ